MVGVDWINSIGPLVTALATIAIAVLTWRYVHYARAQWKAMNDQLPEIKNSADGAKSSADTARESLESVQRAFVTFKSINMDYIPKTNKTKGAAWISYAMLENSGTTPAIDKIQHFTGSNKVKGKPSEDDFIGKAPDIIIGGEVGPRAPFNLGRYIVGDDFMLGGFPLSSITTEKFDKWFSARKIFFWGWIGYRDVFPKTYPHITEFCEWVDEVAANVHWTPRVGFEQCSEHNCTDKHCGDYYILSAKVPY